METNVPAKVSRNKPYLSVSFRAARIASSLETTISFLNERMTSVIVNVIKHLKDETKTLFIYLFFLPWRLFTCNRAKIAKRVRPPLRPAPIEKSFAETKRILWSFSHSFDGIASTMQRIADDETIEGADILVWPLLKPLISSRGKRWFSPWSAKDGDRGIMEEYGLGGSYFKEWRQEKRREGNKDKRVIELTNWRFSLRVA